MRSAKKDKPKQDTGYHFGNASTPPPVSIESQKQRRLSRKKQETQQLRPQSASFKLPKDRDGHTFEFRMRDYNQRNNEKRNVNERAHSDLSTVAVSERERMQIRKEKLQLTPSTTTTSKSSNSMGSDSKSRESIHSKSRSTENMNHSKRSKCSQCGEQSKRFQSVSMEIDRTAQELSDLKNMVRDLRIENKQYGQQLEGLKFEEMALRKETVLLEEDCQDIEYEIVDLKQQIEALQKRRKRAMSQNQRVRVNLKEWREWNVDEILQWILTMDNRKYGKYAQTLVDRLSVEKIKGNELHLITEQDLVYFGISNVIDRKEILQQIQLLKSGAHGHIVEEMSPPPIAYHNGNVPDLLPNSPQSMLSAAPVEGLKKRPL